MISSAIWNKYARANFFRRVVFEKINKCLFIPNCEKRKIV